MASTIQVRVDDDLKVKSDQLFKDLGTDTTTAIRMFLTQALAVNGFPFEIKKISANLYGALSEDEILKKLEKARDPMTNSRPSRHPPSQTARTPLLRPLPTTWTSWKP